MSEKILKNLQEFTNLYFKRKVPKVEWKEMEYSGLAVEEENKIYLNPKIPLKEKSLSVKIGEFIYTPKTKLNLSDKEKYFHVLLNEIAHFKIKMKPPREYYSLRSKLRKRYPGNLELQHYEAETFINLKKDETEEEYIGRLGDFRTWLLHGWTSKEHAKVEDWAIEEFKKQRKKVREIIKNWKI